LLLKFSNSFELIVSHRLALNFLLKSKSSSRNVMLTHTAVMSTEAALLENNEASAELTTANGGTFTSSSARLSSQSRYKSLDQ